MTINFVDKVSPINSEVIFSINDQNLPDRLRLGLTHNFIEILSLDGSGNPAQPTSGSYEILVKLSDVGVFSKIVDNGTILARKTSGSLLPDGSGVIASFAANPFEIKVIPTNVDIASQYKVHVRQNLT